MAHHTARAAYKQLEERLNRFPQGAPPSKLLYQILEMLFSEREAELVSRLPVKSFSVEQASRVWKMDLVSTRNTLEELASRGILVDIPRDEASVYLLPPPMAGFFEFSMMRVRSDIDQKVLSELFYQYLNVEEDFITSLFSKGETQLGRAFVQEPVLTSEQALHVLDYERASETFKTASHIAVGVCYCRHKMEHVGLACDAPMEICTTFNNVAASLIKHGIARQIDVEEGLDLLQQAYDHNLVQFGENSRNRVSFICHCCGCCCEALIAARKFGFMHPVHTTNFLPVIDRDTCTGCGKCVAACPVEAMTLVSANDPKKPNRKVAKLDQNICLGCGVCVKPCPTQSIRLESRPERVITPVNSTHRIVMMAIERGDLQDLIFDKQYLQSHRALAAIFGVILNLPPVKRVLASQQVKSRYLEWLITHVKF